MCTATGINHGGLRVGFSNRPVRTFIDMPIKAKRSIELRKRVKEK